MILEIISRILFILYRQIFFETKIFEFTGTNICIGFFTRKTNPSLTPIQFNGIKIKKGDNILKLDYVLKPEWKYRGGAGFDDFTKDYQAKKPLNVKYYLLNEDVQKNKGNQCIKVIDTNAYVFW